MNEQEALAVLASNASTYDKAMACDLLGRIGTGKAVPALAALLPDAQLNDYARDGLERIPDPAAVQALIDSLDKVEGKLRVGVIITLGDRGDAAAVPALAKVAGGSDVGEARAALTSLGQIGDGAGNRAILEALSGGSAEVKVLAAHAALLAADTVEKNGGSDAAAELRKAVAGADVPGNLKEAARG